MPIYEFYSPDTHKIYSFLARGITSAIPKCPDNPKARMEKLLSRFAVTGRAKEKADSPAGGEDLDPRMAGLMADMEREMAGMDETNPDPRQLGKLMRKMTEATGQKMPAEMEQMLRRLESGEDPEKLEEEFGDALDQIGEGDLGDSPEAKETKAALRARRRSPARDPKLYEMRDYL